MMPSWAEASLQRNPWRQRRPANKDQTDAAGYLDTYPYTVERGVTCVCGEKLPKGTLAVMSVTDPRGDSPWYRHKIVCSFECAIQVQLDTALYWEKEMEKRKLGMGSDE